MEEKDSTKKVEKEDHNEIEEQAVHRHNRELEDMPSSYRGRGPQENSDIGYDALEDL